jgi:hypothetical protein
MPGSEREPCAGLSEASIPFKKLQADGGKMLIHLRLFSQRCRDRRESSKPGEPINPRLCEVAELAGDQEAKALISQIGGRSLRVIRKPSPWRMKALCVGEKRVTDIIHAGGARFGFPSSRAADALNVLLADRTGQLARTLCTSRLYAHVLTGCRRSDGTTASRNAVRALRSASQRLTALQ